MRKVFSSNNVSEIMLVGDALAQRRVAVTLVNEYSGGSAVPEFRPPAEIWIQHDEDYDRARQCVVNTLATLDGKSEGTPWRCLHCQEQNPPAFELCWNCGQARAEPQAP